MVHSTIPKRGREHGGVQSEVEGLLLGGCECTLAIRALAQLYFGSDKYWVQSPEEHPIQL